MTARLEALFPDLRTSGYRQTSDADASYNCVAWAAAGAKDRWWECAPGYYWPVTAPFSATVETVVLMLKWLGFAECDSAEVEAGFEKVAVYAQDGEYTHVARQLPSAKWTSKIGGLEDIEHDDLRGLLGVEYGAVDRILKRELVKASTATRPSND